MKVSAVQPFQIHLLAVSARVPRIHPGIFHCSPGRQGQAHLPAPEYIIKEWHREFGKGLDDRDFELIELLDSMNQDAVLRHFSRKIMKPDEFSVRFSRRTKGDVLLQEQIEAYMEKRRAAALEKIKGKMLFEMGNDGDLPGAGLKSLRRGQVFSFHFMRSEENTNYYPTITYNDKKVDIPSPMAYLVCKHPAWMVVNGKLYGFDKPVDGKKLLSVPEQEIRGYPKKILRDLLQSFCRAFDCIFR